MFCEFGQPSEDSEYSALSKVELKKLFANKQVNTTQHKVIFVCGMKISELLGCVLIGVGFCR